MRAFGEAPALIIFKVRLVGVLIRQDWTLNLSLGQGCVGMDTKGLDLKGRLHGHLVACSENASMVPNAATPMRATAKGPSVFLFINPYWSKRSTPGILEKFNPASGSSVTRHVSCHGHHLCGLSEQFIVS